MDRRQIFSFRTLKKESRKMDSAAAVAAAKISCVMMGCKLKESEFCFGSSFYIDDTAGKDDLIS